MDRKKKIFIVGLVVLITIAVIQQVRMRRIGRANFKFFNESEISGIVQGKVRASTAGTFFKVNGQTFNFLPYTGLLNNNSIFSYTAENGDSIYKEKGSDTLFLFKKGLTYKYTFSNLSDK